MGDRDDALLAETLREGERALLRFSSWRPDIFEDWTLTLLPPIWRLDAGSGRALLAVITEGVGQGLLGPLPEAPISLLDALLRGPIMQWLPGLTPQARKDLLVCAFNLGEGCAKEPPFLDRYLRSRVETLTGPEHLSADLARELDPLLDPLPDAPWRGPYEVHVLDLRATDDRFLPGEMTLAGPRILAVTDRRRPVTLGVLLGPGAPSVLGPIEAQGATEAVASPALSFTACAVRIGEIEVALPMLHEPYTTALAPAGYLAASAENSQRLWVVAHA